MNNLEEETRRYGIFLCDLCSEVNVHEIETEKVPEKLIGLVCKQCKQISNQSFKRLQDWLKDLAPPNS